MADIPEHLAQELKSDCGHTLGEILERKSESDFENLRSLLSMDKSIDPAMRQNAIDVLGRWGDPRVVPDIVRLLPDLDERELINAIDTLGRLGTPEAASAIAQRVKHPSPDVRRFVVYALDRVGGKDTDELLREIATTDDTGFVRAKAQQVLRKRDTQNLK